MTENERLERRARDQERSAAQALAQSPREAVLIPPAPDGERELYGCWHGIPVRYPPRQRALFPHLLPCPSPSHRQCLNPRILRAWKSPSLCRATHSILSFS